MVSPPPPPPPAPSCIFVIKIEVMRNCQLGLGGLCSFFKYYAMPAMLIYSIFMLVESTIMLNTMLTVVAKITTKKSWLTCDIPMATADLCSDSDIEPSSDIEC